MSDPVKSVSEVMGIVSKANLSPEDKLSAIREIVAESKPKRRKKDEEETSTRGDVKGTHDRLE